MHRPERMADSLLEEITEIVGFELEDPRLLSVTVTDVRVAENLKNANVFVLVKGTEKQIGEALVTLNRAASFVRGKVALSMNMRYAPVLHFLRDTVEENAARIESKLGELDLSLEDEDLVEKDIISGEEE